MLVLGIETSCDETAAAVLAEGFEVRSNVVASQEALHTPYGGVVPELASRDHIRRTLPLARGLLEQAGCGTRSLGAVAYTEGPGLAGALLERREQEPQGVAAPRLACAHRSLQVVIDASF